MTELFIKLFKSPVLLGYLGSVLRAAGLQFGYLVIVLLNKIFALFLVVAELNEILLPCFLSASSLALLVESISLSLF